MNAVRSDSEAAQLAKQLCRQAGKRFIPLRQHDLPARRVAAAERDDLADAAN